MSGNALQDKKKKDLAAELTASCESWNGCRALSHTHSHTCRVFCTDLGAGRGKEIYIVCVCVGTGDGGVVAGGGRQR